MNILIELLFQIGKEYQRLRNILDDGKLGLDFQGVIEIHQNVREHNKMNSIIGLIKGGGHITDVQYSIHNYNNNSNL